MASGFERSPAASVKKEHLPLTDSTPAKPGEVRVDSEGHEWVYAASGHTVADELALRDAGSDYWEQRFALRDRALRGDAAAAGEAPDVAAPDSVFADPHYTWQLIR